MCSSPIITGTVAGFPSGPAVKLGRADDVKHNQGAIGPAHRGERALGSFASAVKTGPHAHMIQADSSGNFVLGQRFGILDQIMVWKFDVEKGRSPLLNDPPFVSLTPGDGPPSFCFHPNGRWLFRAGGGFKLVLLD